MDHYQSEPGRWLRAVGPHLPTSSDDALIMGCAARCDADRIYIFNLADFQLLAPAKLQEKVCAVKSVRLDQVGQGLGRRRFRAVDLLRERVMEHFDGHGPSIARYGPRHFV